MPFLKLTTTMGAKVSVGTRSIKELRPLPGGRTLVVRTYHGKINRSVIEAMESPAEIQAMLDDAMPTLPRAEAGTGVGTAQKGPRQPAEAAAETVADGCLT